MQDLIEIPNQFILRPVTHLKWIYQPIFIIYYANYLITKGKVLNLFEIFFWIFSMEKQHHLQPNLTIQKKIKNFNTLINSNFQTFFLRFLVEFRYILMNTL